MVPFLKKGPLMWQCDNTHFHLQGCIRVRQCWKTGGLISAGRVWTGPSQWGASAIDIGNGYKMRPERKAGQGDHMVHSRPFWRPWALAGGRRGPRGGL